MTADECMLLLTGIAIGGNAANVFHMLWMSRDAQRNLARSARLRRINAADNFLGTFRIYQLHGRRGRP